VTYTTSGGGKHKSWGAECGYIAGTCMVSATRLNLEAILANHSKEIVSSY